jgi:CheY-like chemotaxis protein
MDVVMPLLDGLEATRRLRQLPDSANIPIVVASASAADEDRRKSLAVGATDFVPKPIDLNRFQQLVGRLLQLTWTVDDD